MELRPRARTSPLRFGLWLTGLLATSFSGCACEDDPLTQTPDSGVVDSGTTGGRCVKDEDCGARNACNTRLGLCYPLDECDTTRPCPMNGQVCEDIDGDTFLDCAFPRCEDNDECADEECGNDQVPACLAGVCTCAAPCQGGCPTAQGCCIPEDRCYDLPPRCMGLACGPGQFLSITATGAWDQGSCALVGEACRCENLPPIPLGDVGLYSALARSGDEHHLSAYNRTYGDLMYGLAIGDGAIAWSFVDGVPTATATIEGDPSGPRGGQAAPGDDVGWYTDLAVDAAGQPHIAYHDRGNGGLKYAVRTGGVWKTHTIEAAGTSGLYPSIVLANGRPRIVYLTAREPVRGSLVARKSTLRLAVATVATPERSADWVIRDLETLDLSPFGCVESCGPEEVCRASDKACVVPDERACPAGCGSGQACIAGLCTAVDPLPPYRDLPLARGLWPSLQTTGDGGLLVAYHDRVETNLKIARIAGPDPVAGAITRQLIDGADDTGYFPSLFVTPGGEIHLTYMSATRRALVYRGLNAQLGTIGGPEDVEVGLGTNGMADVLIGADPALVVDAQGAVRIAYQNASTGEVRYARREGPSQWNVSTLLPTTMMPGFFGFFTDQTLDAQRGDPRVSSYRYLLSTRGSGVVLVRP